MSGYFITATGTGSGKTFTTCALLHAARMQGRKAYAFKPVISGWEEGDPTTDTAHIIQASGQDWTVDALSPWRYAAPLSPHRAAVLEGKTLPFDALVDWSRKQLRNDLTLIEGVGGVMVPLDGSHTVLDWMRALNLPVILVTGSYLGSISHTLTALEVLKQAGLNTHALVVNESPDSSVDLTEAQAGLEPLVQTIPLRIFQPLVSSPHNAQAIHALLPHL